MSNVIKVKKGLDIKLKGVADKVYGNAAMPETFAVKPTDFHGVVPKLMIKEGDKVKAGSPLFFDKYNDKVRFASPVSGEVVEIKRGEKRKILEIRIKADKDTAYESYQPKSANRDEVIESMCNAGLWVFVKQRPYDVIANPADKPKAVFVSAFDSSPLAADLDFCLHGQQDDFQAGLDALAKLTDGKVHLNVHQTKNTSEVFKSAKNVQKNVFDGPHPSGLAGVQINKIAPLNKGERVWTVDAQRVVIIGRFFRTGKYDASINIALAGSMVEKPRYYKTVIGANVKNIIDGAITKNTEPRFISGNVLTGTAIHADGYLGYYDNMLTVIPEGREAQPFGWIAPNFHKFSLSRTFFSWLTPSKEYSLNTNMNGEHRSFVVTGQYEEVFPMDVMPQQLIKAIMIEDIEAMENLGIYEVAPEDFALCEFVCTSKMDLQEIVREGLDVAKQELG